ncbi:MAG TPA: YajQ family cyclic di-GMP-binding protein [Gammaproteobacteria bacterium]|nr:YajQ family cyclic di-GMP-binding protein [Gammaproteobacteria bacterium]
MPSFDIVSEFERHEAGNAVDQANRELATRFDFRGSEASFKLNDDVITSTGDSEFQLGQMLDIVQTKLHKRGIDIACLEVGDPQPSGKTVVQLLTLRQGIDSDLARKLVKLIKEKKLKVQAAIQGDKVRVTGKKRDDLQRVIAMLREQELGMPLQFNNFR